jgi:hypothetical protein
MWPVVVHQDLRGTLALDAIAYSSVKLHLRVAQFHAHPMLLRLTRKPRELIKFMRQFRSSWSNGHSLRSEAEAGWPISSQWQFTGDWARFLDWWCGTIDVHHTFYRNFRSWGGWRGLQPSYARPAFKQPGSGLTLAPSASYHFISRQIMSSYRWLINRRSFDARAPYGNNRSWSLPLLQVMLTFTSWDFGPKAARLSLTTMHLRFCKLLENGRPAKSRRCIEN